MYKTVKAYMKHHLTYQKDFFKTPAKLIDNSTHMRNKDEDAKRTQAAQDHEDLSARILRNTGRHPAEKYKTHLKTVQSHTSITHSIHQTSKHLKLCIELKKAIKSKQRRNSLRK